MPKPKRVLEWKVLLSDTEWNRRESLDDLLDTANALPTAQWRPRISRRWAVGFLAALMVGSGAYFLWREAQTGLELINNDLARVVTAEVWPAQTVKIDDVALQAGLAMVAVTTVDAAGNSYRQTHFYQDDPHTGWQRTAPATSFWGAQQSIQTEHLHWRYHALDAKAVTEVAQQTDRFYLQLRHALGLPPPSSTQKLIIEVTATTLDSPTAELAANRLVTNSPHLITAPIEVSQSEVLHATVQRLLLQHTLHLAQEEQPVWCIWRPLLAGFEQWQLHRSGALPINIEGEPAHVAPSLQALRGSNETCLDRPVTQLTSGPGDPTSTALAETLFAYVVESYGAEGVPALLSALRRYSTWEHVLHAAFATSEEPFEAGWQAHLAKQTPQHR